MQNKLKVLVFDIETSPIIAYVWGTRDQNISLNQIKHDWYVLAWAAKWLGEPAAKTMYLDNRDAKDLSDDKALLLALWKLLDEADIVITQNGVRFDSRKLNARFIMHGIRPPSPYKHIDTYQILSRAADFTSDKLEYYSQKLCKKYKKLDHGKFPGMALWDQCLKGNVKAWDEMRKYNIHDVLATEELYLTVRAWTPSTAPVIYPGNPENRCGVCGSKHVKLNGFSYSSKGTMKYRRLRCYDCNKTTLGRGEKAFKEA